MGQGSKNKTALNYLFKLSWLLDGLVHNVFSSLIYFSIYTTTVPGALCLLLRLNNGAREEDLAIQLWLAVAQPLFTILSPIWTSSTFWFCCFFPSDLHSNKQGGVISVCGVFVEIIKQMVVGFCWGLMLYFGHWVWILRAFLKQFKRSERTLELLQDFEDGYILHAYSYRGVFILAR